MAHVVAVRPEGHLRTGHLPHHRPGHRHPRGPNLPRPAGARRLMAGGRGLHDQPLPGVDESHRQPPRRRAADRPLGAMVAVASAPRSRPPVHQDRAGRVARRRSASRPTRAPSASATTSRSILPGPRLGAAPRGPRVAAKRRCAPDAAEHDHVRAARVPPHHAGSGAERSGTGAWAATTAGPSTASTRPQATGRTRRARAARPPRPPARSASTPIWTPSELHPAVPATRDAGDEVQPPERQPRRPVEHRGDRSPGHAGDHAGGQAPHHHQPGDRHREQVGGQRRDGDRAERRRGAPGPRRAGRPA